MGDNRSITDSGQRGLGVIRRAELLTAAAELPSEEITMPAELLQQLYDTTAALAALRARQWTLSPAITGRADDATERLRELLHRRRRTP